MKDCLLEYLLDIISAAQRREFYLDAEQRLMDRKASYDAEVNSYNSRIAELERKRSEALRKKYESEGQYDPIKIIIGGLVCVPIIAMPCMMILSIIVGVFFHGNLPLALCFIISMGIGILLTIITLIAGPDTDTPAMYGSEADRLARDILYEKEKRDDYKVNLDKFCQKINAAHTEALKSDQVLKQLFETNVLGRKYQNIEAVLYIYEYLADGTCDTLKEAYNRYELDSRLDEIIDGIATLNNTVRSAITMLHNIQNGMDDFRRSVLDGMEKQNTILSGMSNRLHTLDTNIANANEQHQLDNVNVERIARSTEYLAFAARQNRLLNGNWS